MTVGPTTFGLALVLIGLGSLVGAVTQHPLLVAMFDGVSPGRSRDPAITRIGMVLGGVIALLLGLAIGSGALPVGFAGDEPPAPAASSP